MQEQIEFREQEEQDGISEEGKQKVGGGGGGRNGKKERGKEREMVKIGGMTEKRKGTFFILFSFRLFSLQCHLSHTYK